MEQTKSISTAEPHQGVPHGRETTFRSEWSLPRGRVWIALALTHLLLVCFGIAQFPFYDLKHVGVPLGIYADLSGAGNGYGFFSPGIYSQIRSRLDVYEIDGTKRTFSFDEQNNREAELRFNDVVEQFINTFEDPIQFQRSLAASLAGSVFAQDARAHKIDVRVQRFAPPSRVDYLKGQRAQWEDIYSAAFVHPKGGNGMDSGGGSAKHPKRTTTDNESHEQDIGSFDL